jgi:hypothetical protein
MQNAIGARFKQVSGLVPAGADARIDIWNRMWTTLWTRLQA